jgi:hypothetical protein
MSSDAPNPHCETGVLFIFSTSCWSTARQDSLASPSRSVMLLGQVNGVRNGDPVKHTPKKYVYLISDTPSCVPHYRTN